MEFVSKLGIPYENGGHVALYVNREVVITIDKIRPLLKVDVVDTMVVLTDEGGLGGGMPPVVVVIEGVSGFPIEVVAFSSIASCKTI
jgi:hypothetical protein